MRQAPKLWYEPLAHARKEIGFYRSRSSNSLYISSDRVRPVYLLVYVYCIMIVDAKQDVRAAKQKLSSLFTTRDRMISTHFLGIKIERRPNGLFLTQTPYMQNIVALEGMKNTKQMTSVLPLTNPLYEVMQE